MNGANAVSGDSSRKPGHKSFYINTGANDNMGRKTQTIVPSDIHGNWYLNTTSWTPGIYIVRMEGDGQELQSQRVVVTH